MSSNLKFSLGIAAVAVLGVGAAFLLFRPDPGPAVEQSDGKVTVVEYLDFQCGPCGMAFPHVERLRKEYEGRITYTAKMFPLPSHRHARPAARAAQAAANQGKFDAMYTKIFTTQATWSAQPEAAPVFAGYARELGLDMARYDRDVTDSDTDKRIKADIDEGTKAGVSGTPTFFIAGKRFTGQPNYEGLKSAIDAALAK